MPKRTDLRSILIVGSGPIRIGQACEFDYSGAQACRVLRREGYRVVLVNSNPATIMTDPEWADATYLEPLDAETVAEVIERERPDALLPTLGGQTALNLAVELHEAGVLAAPRRRADRRERRRDPPRRGPARLPRRDGGGRAAGRRQPRRRLGGRARRASAAGDRPAGLHARRDGRRARADAARELEAQVARGLAASPIGQVLVERSLEGWQEHELEVMADAAGNCVVVCSIENLDPMGVHTGDSWTVAPQQTLSDPEFQRLREAAFACAARVGVATGGANVQFAYEPATRELVLIEMNPRVSRSSALASKATGFPIAKLAALLAVGYTLDELPNDITGKTTAAFEPALDYVAVKAPRFDFAKFPEAEPRLGSEMRAGRRGARARADVPRGVPEGARGARGRAVRARPLAPRRAGSRALGSAARGGPAELDLPGIHPYFADELRAIAAAERELAGSGDVAAAKRFGLPDSAIARVLGIDEAEVAAPPPAAGAARRRLVRRRVRGADALLLPLLRGGRRRRTTARPAAPCSSSARARTGSGRGSSSTTAARARRSPSAASATRSCS